MKNTLIAVLVLSMLAGCTSLSTLAVTSDNSKDRGIISVNTTAESDMTPDVADISFAVKTTDTKSMQTATSANKELSDKVYAILKSYINPQNGDYIKTSDFNASPIYSYQSSKRVFDKYEVSNRVVVHTKSLDNLGKMIDSALKAGATNVDSLNFSLSNYDNKCDELLTTATKKAYSRANTLAKAANSTILGISNINTSCGTNNANTPRLYMAKNTLSTLAEDSVSASGMSISNGIVKINAQVNASFFVK